MLTAHVQSKSTNFSPRANYFAIFPLKLWDTCDSGLQIACRYMQWFIDQFCRDQIPFNSTQPNIAPCCNPNIVKHCHMANQVNNPVSRRPLSLLCRLYLSARPPPGTGRGAEWRHDDNRRRSTACRRPRHLQGKLNQMSMLPAVISATQAVPLALLFEKTICSRLGGERDSAVVCNLIQHRPTAWNSHCKPTNVDYVLYPASLV